MTADHPAERPSSTVKRKAVSDRHDDGPGMRSAGLLDHPRSHAQAAPVSPCNYRARGGDPAGGDGPKLVGAAPDQPAASNDSARDHDQSGGRPHQRDAVRRTAAHCVYQCRCASTLPACRAGAPHSTAVNRPGAAPGRGHVAHLQPARFAAAGNVCRQREVVCPVVSRRKGPASTWRVCAHAPDGSALTWPSPGVRRRLGPATADDGGFGGVIAMDLGVIGDAGGCSVPTARRNASHDSFLVMLGAKFPPPGIQLSFGFALDAVGGLVGINHRVDVTETPAARQRRQCGPGVVPRAPCRARRRGDRRAVRHRSRRPAAGS